MTKSKKFTSSGCPIRFASTILGDKWNLMILRDLMFKDRHYYGDFLAAGEGVATNILAGRLVHLETENIVQKQRDPHNGTRVLYFLTQKGLALMPTMLAMMEWSEIYDQNTEVSRSFANANRTDRPGLQNEILDGIKQQVRQALH